MKQNTVELTLSQLIEDLNSGLTWLKKEDVGYGSIQEKYQANEMNIKTIQKHPKLVGIEPSITIFKIIDDLKDQNSTTTQEKESAVTDTKSSKPLTSKPIEKPISTEDKQISEASSSTTESEDAFDGL